MVSEATSRRESDSGKFRGSRLVLSLLCSSAQVYLRSPAPKKRQCSSKLYF